MTHAFWHLAAARSEAPLLVSLLALLEVLRRLGQLFVVAFVFAQVVRASQVVRTWVASLFVPAGSVWRAPRHGDIIFVDYYVWRPLVWKSGWPKRSLLPARGFYGRIWRTGTGWDHETTSEPLDPWKLACQAKRLSEDEADAEREKLRYAPGASTP